MFEVYCFLIFILHILEGKIPVKSEIMWCTDIELIAHVTWNCSVV